MLIEREPGTDWRDLQKRVAAILEESGFVVEVARPLKTARGNVEIDVHAIDPNTTPPAIYLCECKRWTSNVPKAEVQTFRTIMADSGAHFGLFISACGFQKGAYNVVQHTNIQLLTWAQFQELILERWCRTYWVPTLRTRGDRMAGYVEPPGSDAMIREAHGEPITKAEAVGIFVHGMWGHPFNNMAAAMLGQPDAPVVHAIWNRRDKYRKYLPKAAAEANFLRELLDALLGFVSRWERK